jgi:hypothetical protein
MLFNGRLPHPEPLGFSTSRSASNGQGNQGSNNLNGDPAQWNGRAGQGGDGNDSNGAAHPAATSPTAA